MIQPSSDIRTWTRRRVLAGALGCGAAVLVVACAAPASTPSPTTSAGQASTKPTGPTAAPAQQAQSGNAVTLRLETYADRSEFDIWKGLADKFNSSQSKVKLTPEFVSGQDVYAKYETEMAAGTAADIMEFEDKRMPSYASRGGLLDLTGYISRGQSLKKEDYFPLDWDKTFYKGKQYLLPLESVPGIFFVNLDAFNKAGVPVPSEKWGNESWNNDAFLDTIGKLTKGEGASKSFGYNMSTWWVYLQPFIWSNGGGILNADRTQAILDQPACYEMIQWVADIRLKQKYMPMPDQATEGVENLFAGGRIAMEFTNVAWAVPLRKMQGFKWDIRPTPLGKSGQVTRDPANSWAGYAKSKNPDPTYQAIAFLSGDEAMRNTRGVPSKVAIAEKGQFPLATIPNFTWQVLVEAKKQHTRSADVTPVFQQMDNMLKAAFDQVWLGKKDAKTVTAELKPKVDDLLKKQNE